MINLPVGQTTLEAFTVLDQGATKTGHSLCDTGFSAKRCISKLRHFPCVIVSKEGARD
jgi:hypothetical protein